MCLHIIRMTLLVKLVNKSTNLKVQQRLQKQRQVEQVETSGISIDLFHINQVTKNEVGKDQDMIESFFLESLKSIYMTVIQYLQKVPYHEPDFFQDTEKVDDRQQADQNDAAAEAIAEKDSRREESLEQSEGASYSGRDSPSVRSNANTETNLAELNSDDFITIRMKKLFSTILAEFKSTGPFSYLKDNEQQRFLNENYREKNYLKYHFENFKFDGFEKKSNTRLLGLNAEDLRFYLVYQF